MKKILLMVVLVLMLSSCDKEIIPDEAIYEYDEDQLVLEINEDVPDYASIIDSTNYDEFTIDDSSVMYDTLGEYPLYISVDVEGTSIYEVTVTITDTTDPVIVISDDFKMQYDYEELLSIDELQVNDNSLEDINAEVTITHYFADLYYVDIYAEDSSGNNTEERITVTMIGPVVPTIDLSLVESGFAFLEVNHEIKDVDDVGYDYEITLYSGGVLIERMAITDLNAGAMFDENVQEGNEYMIKVTGHYSYLEVDYIVEETMTVDSRGFVLPNISIDSVDYDDMGIHVVVDVEDDAQILLLINLLLITKDDGVTVNTIVVDESGSYTLPDYYNDMDYEVKVEYEYSVNDTETEIDSVFEDISIVELTGPSIEYEELLGLNSIDTVSVIEDVDNVSVSLTISLHSNGALIDSVTHVFLEDETVFFYGFDDLNPDVLYDLEYVYTYDLNTGALDSISETVSKAYLLPKIIVDVFDFDESIVEPSDSINIEIDLNNPEAYDINGFVINGVMYGSFNVVEGMYVIDYIVPNENSIVEYVLEEIHYYDGEDLIQYTNAVNEIIIIGDLSVIGINQDNVDHFAQIDDVYQLVIDLNNPLGSTVTSIQINGIAYFSNDYTVNEENTELILEIEVGDTIGNNELELGLITYNYHSNNYSTILTGTYDYHYYVNDFGNPTYIYTAADLLDISLDSTGVYVLNADIDLSGEDWVPISSFGGYLDGNGYKISNMSMELNVVDRENYGLFGVLESSSYIENITMDNVSFYGSTVYFNNVGSLAGTGSGVVKNSVFDGDIVILLAVDAGYNIGGVFGITSNAIFEGVVSDFEIDIEENVSGITNLIVGQITGDCSSCTMNRVSVSGSIDVEFVDYRYVGGVVGKSEDSYYSQVASNVSISTNLGSSQAIGGFIGQTENCLIENSYVTGDITIIAAIGNNNIGGFVGYGFDTHYKHIYAYNDISYTTTGDLSLTKYVGGIVGSAGLSTSFTNVLRGGNISFYGSQLSMNSSLYYGFIFGRTTTSIEESTYFIVDESAIVLNVSTYHMVGETTHVEDTTYPTLEELYETAFYKDSLEFDSDMWDYDNFNYGYLPILVHVEDQDYYSIVPIT